MRRASWGLVGADLGWLGFLCLVVLCGVGIIYLLGVPGGLVSPVEFWGGVKLFGVGWDCLGFWWVWRFGWVAVWLV